MSSEWKSGKMDLTDKIAVVYAGARGIGKSYCEALLKHRCKVSLQFYTKIITWIIYNI